MSRLGDRLGYYTTKRLLNHRTSDVTQGYVQFDLEQLRTAMQAVEEFVLAHVSVKSASNYLDPLALSNSSDHMNGGRLRTSLSAVQVASDMAACAPIET